MSATRPPPHPQNQSKKLSASSSSIDWYLLRIILHLVVYAGVAVVVLYSDHAADVLYQAVGVVGYLIKIFDPYNHLVSDLYYVRCASRALRPISMLKHGVEYYTSKYFVKAIYYLLYAVSDFLAALYGTATFFHFPRKDIIGALQRESSFLRCLFSIYFGYSYGDWIVVVGNVCDALSKNSLVLMLPLGDALPGRVVAGTGAIAASQKLWYLMKH